jgi:hypothetical protein
MNGDHGLGCGPIRDGGAFVHTRPDSTVVRLGQHHMHPPRGQRIANAEADIPGEGGLGVTRVGCGARGVARLGTPATVRDRAVDLRRMRSVGTVVLGVEGDQVGINRDFM